METDFKTREQLILSGQVDEAIIQQWLKDVPGFDRWYRARAAQRQGSAG